MNLRQKMTKSKFFNFCMISLLISCSKELKIGVDKQTNKIFTNGKIIRDVQLIRYNDNNTVGCMLSMHKKSERDGKSELSLSIIDTLNYSVYYGNCKFYHNDSVVVIVNVLGETDTLYYRWQGLPL
jgi:hypothetical protein